VSLPFVLAQAATQVAHIPRSTDATWLERMMGVVGLGVMILIAYAMSENRRRVDWRLVWMGMLLQAVFAVLVLKTAPGLWFFSKVSVLVDALLAFTEQGARFIFGNLAQSDPPGMVPVGPLKPDGSIDQAAGYWAHTGSFFAFNVLPTIIFLSSLMSVLYYLGVMQPVVNGIARIMQKTMRTSGAETLSASANIFLGQTESPLVVKPFVNRMTSSELFNVMVCGFATASGGVLAAYTLMLRGVVPNVAGHLLAATILQTPAAVVLAKIMVPETGQPETMGSMPVTVEQRDTNVIEAAASGASEGVALALNVGGMLIAFIALIAAVNAIISWGGGLFHHPEFTLQSILGVFLRPLAWVMGVPWQDTQYVASIIGVKTALNEFVAFGQFANDLKNNTIAITPRSALITSYAVVGFANFSSIAIQVGGIGGMAPDRKSEIARLGLRGMIAGNLAAFMSACWAGILL
jgi:CNT family concentrative nucleoside transporter